jgi:hypothetical protein
MKFQRPSDLRHGPTTPWKSNQTEDQPTSDAQQPTQDGGNCSDTKTTSSPMKEERLSQFKEDKTMRIETLL